MAEPNSKIPRVSIVIVNWNRRELLEACLRSLRTQTFQDYEVIVVDNASSDGSREMLTKDYPAVRVVPNPDNFGFARANNQGFEICRGEFVAILNNDAELEPHCLERLVRVFDIAPNVGMAAPKILRFDRRTVIDKVGHVIYADGQNRGRGTGEQDRGQYDKLEEIAWPDGAAAMYRKSMLDAIGGFDEDFFAYAEDAELGLRARIAGWRCFYEPQARVYHHHSSTLGRFSEKRIALIERNRIWLAAKLFPMSLLVMNPLFFSLRLGASLVGVAAGKGEAASFSEAQGTFRLARGFLRGHLSGIAGVPRMLRKRAAIGRIRRLTGRELKALLRTYRISLRTMAFESA